VIPHGETFTEHVDDLDALGGWELVHRSVLTELFQLASILFILKFRGVLCLATFHVAGVEGLFLNKELPT
jgi:hypothetical protein